MHRDKTAIRISLPLQILHNGIISLVTEPKHILSSFCAVETTYQRVVNASKTPYATENNRSFVSRVKLILQNDVSLTDHAKA